MHEAFVGGGADDGLDLGGEEFDLGLRLELGVGVLDGDDGGEAFADVVAGDLGVFVFEEFVGLGELVNCAGEGAAETGEVGAAVGVVDGVGVAENLVVEGVVVLEHDLDVDLVGLIVDGDLELTEDADGAGVEDLFALVELADELDDAVLVEKDLGFGDGGALVDETDFEAGVEKGELAEALGDALGDKDGGLAEDLGVGLKGDEGAGAAGGADDGEFFGGFTTLEFHVMDGVAAGDLDLEPFGNGVDAFGADAVGAAGELVAALAVFAAGVQGGEHHLDAGDAVLGGGYRRGMPRPSSRIEMEPSTWMATSILRQ